MGKAEGYRFETVLEETYAAAIGSKILKDRETGVLYYFHRIGTAGGLTPLLDKNGKPLLDSDSQTK